jgi:hypothetical protein
VRFWEFLGKGNSKKRGGNKDVSKTFTGEIFFRGRKKSGWMVFYFFSFEIFDALVKRLSKGFSKKSTKQKKNGFFLDLCNHVLGRFSVRGVQKHFLKTSEFF